MEDAAAFTGGVEDAAPWHRAFDVFLLTSNHEGMPNVVLEAMAAGKPVIATDVAGVHELIEDGVTGIVLPRKRPLLMARRLVELLRNPELRKEMGRAAQQRVRQHFSFDAMVQRHVELYEELFR